LETTLATTTQVLEKLMQQHGLVPRDWLHRYGIDPALLTDPRARVPVDATDALLRALAQVIPDPAFGLGAAHCWHPTNLGPLGHAWLASSTLRRGLQRMQRYWQLIGQRSALSLREENLGLAVVLDNRVTDPVVAAITTDLCFSVLVDMCRRNAGEGFVPSQVRLVRREPADRSPYDRFFGCPVVYGAAERCIVLSSSDADAPLPTSNRELVGVLEQMLAGELARLDRSDTVARCRTLLLRRLASGEVTATQVARDLAMSRRTLHRKLADAGTTWQQLVDATRRDLALRLIEDRRRPIGEITFELGFSQQSAFARAFKRWAGQSPTAYRDALPGGRPVAAAQAA
jgi:AraC-like DNA-binding protein